MSIDQRLRNAIVMFSLFAFAALIFINLPEPDMESQFKAKIVMGFLAGLIGFGIGYNL